MRTTFSLIFGTQGGSRTGARGVPPVFQKKFVFINVDFITLIRFDFSQHAIFSICILFTTLTTKKYGMCEGVSKQTPDPIILPRPPVLKFFYPPLRTNIFCSPCVDV